MMYNSNKLAKSGNIYLLVGTKNNINNIKIHFDKINIKNKIYIADNTEKRTLFVEKNGANMNE